MGISSYPFIIADDEIKEHNEAEEFILFSTILISSPCKTSQGSSSGGRSARVVSMKYLKTDFPPGQRLYETSYKLGESRNQAETMRSFHNISIRNCGELPTFPPPILSTSHIKPPKLVE
jgi:hypothetical protein